MEIYLQFSMTLPLIEEMTIHSNFFILASLPVYSQRERKFNENEVKDVENGTEEGELRPKL